MDAKCAHCGEIVNTRTEEGAAHVAQHPPKHSREERRVKRVERKHRRLDRAKKYWDWTV
jgi:hypothetical protein